MTILVIPHLGCNLRCKYCFGNGYEWVDPKMEYDLDAIFKSMELLHRQTRGDSFCMHGGECTLIPRRDFEAILRKMYELQGRSAIQTNGTMIDGDMARLFRKYNTGVGISIDGPPELNVLRGFPDNPKKSREYTKKVIRTMFKLTEQGVSVSVITILHKANAGTKEKLKKLLRFILTLREHGIKGGRLNFMWTNFPEVKEYELTPEEASRAWLYLYRHLKMYPDHQWQPFREFIDNLLGFWHSSCSYGKCDYFCTYGAKVILPDGSLGNCDRTHQEGATYLRATDRPTYERYEVLKVTDCWGCRYWNVCYGGCPAEGIDGDWRNKTRFCKAIYDLYSEIERDIRAMFPNIILVTDHPEVDYYDMLKRGKHLKAFRRMLWEEAACPSSWRGNVMLKEKSTFGVARKCGHGDVPHGDWSDHGDSG